MNRKVLVLNGGLPYQCWSWQDSIENIFSKNCYVLESYNDFPLRAGKGVEIMKCPSVVMLINHIPYYATPKYSKTNLLQRDDYHCQYCGILIQNSSEREIEHVIPRASPDFPGSNFENTVIACTTCNRQKSNKSLKELKKEKCWNGKPFDLIKKPVAPTGKIGYAKYVTMVNKSNIVWLSYIPRWEYYASKMGRDWLFDLYGEYIKEKEKKN